MNTTRPRICAVIGTLLAATLALSGCSTSTTEPEDTASTADGLLPAAEGKTQYPLTLESPWGDTTLEERPERVGAVDVSGFDTELLLALGVTPVTTSSAAIDNAPWSVDAGADKIETIFDANYDDLVQKEKLASASPDLLLGIGDGLQTKDTYEKLSSIAPVLEPETDKDPADIPWQDQLRWLGKTLDLSDRAEKVISDYDQKLKDIAEEHPEFKDKSVNFVVYQGQEYGMSNYTHVGSSADDLFTKIGFKPNTNKDQELSLENLNTVDGDVLLLGNASSESPLKDITDTDVYKRLHVVKDDKVVLLDSEEYGFPVLWSLGAGKVLGKEWILDQLVPLLSDKLK